MRRLVVVAAVCLLALQASGLASFILPGDCAEDCSDDSEGTCSPTCTCCTCCFHPRSYPRGEVARPMTIPRVGRVLVVEGDRRPEAPPASEIFRVPKPALG